MKKILFLMALAVSVNFGAKAQTVTLNVTQNTSCDLLIAGLWAYCPDNPSTTYLMNYSLPAIGTGVHVVGGSGNWLDASTGIPANPPCANLVLLRIEYMDCSFNGQVAITNASSPTTTGDWSCCGGSCSVQVNSSFWPVSNSITVN